MKTRQFGLIAVALLLTVLAIQAASAGALASGTASASEFEPVSASETIRDLKGPALAARPRRVARLSEDIVFPLAAIRALGTAGHVWLHPRWGVCVMMTNDAGGCFSTFRSPLLLFVSGTKNAAGEHGPATVRGVVADFVESVVLVTDAGERINAAIAGNGLSASLPPGASILRQDVTFKNGRTGTYDDAVHPPR
jgi:hypothetical protein